MPVIFNPFDGTIQLVPVSTGGGGGGNSFYIMQTPLGTSPTATSPTDVLTWDNSDGLIDITGNAGTDTIDLTLNLSGFPIASAIDTGFLSNVDWATFDAKQDALTLGDLSTSTTGVTIGAGVGVVVGPGTTVDVQTATGAQPGLLSAADWTTFNSKQAAGNYITALTGDATASGPGSAALTLATVNGAPGSFGSAADTLTATVNAKGLITALSASPVAIAQSQVTDLVADLAGKQPVGNYITSLTGDATGSGPGATALTLATVNGSPGSFGSATDTLTATVNGKGLITALSATPIAIAQSQVTNLTVDLGLKAPLASPAFTTQVTFGNYFMNPSEVDDGNSGASDTINWGTGSAHKSTLTANTTLTFSNPQAGGAYVLRVIQGAGPYTITWPAAVKWAGGTAPTLTPTSGRMDLFNFYYDGTNYYGSFTQDYTP